MICSARATNEENYLAQKFARTMLRTNNIDNCSRLCHAPTAAGLGASFGFAGGTNSFDDLDRADCILLVGANPTEAHPVVGSYRGVMQPIRFGRTPGPPPFAAPTLGQHASELTALTDKKG